MICRVSPSPRSACSFSSLAELGCSSADVMRATCTQQQQQQQQVARALVDVREMGSRLARGMWTRVRACLTFLGVSAQEALLAHLCGPM
jgi:hypothetical protein